MGLRTLVAFAKALKTASPAFASAGRSVPEKPADQPKTETCSEYAIQLPGNPAMGTDA